MLGLDRIARVQRHHVHEVPAIQLCGPHLEPINLGLRHLADVLRVLVELLRELLAFLGAAEVAHDGQENLKRGESLLTVDHLPLLDVGRRRLLLVQHHRAQEVDRPVRSSLDELDELA